MIASELEKIAYRKVMPMYKKHLMKCERCGTLYQAKRTTSQYCNSRCKMRAHRSKSY